MYDVSVAAQVYIKDTKSSNGTYVNDVRLSQTSTASEPHELRQGA